MTKRLAWAGPWNGRSAIATFGTQVVARLADLGHAVEIFRTELGEAANLEPLPAPGPVHPPTPGSVPRLLGGAFDAVLVNLGDNLAFHGAALPILAAAPSVAIVHDVELGGMRLAWTRFPELRAARAPFAGGTPPEEQDQFALLPSLAVGAVAHGAHYLEALAARCPGPVRAIPLCFEHPAVAPPPPLTPGADEFVVVTVGRLNDNKRAGEVVRALGASPRLRGRARYVVAGEAPPEARAALVDLARRVGARPPDFLGHVSDTVLRMVLGGSHAVACLRHPAFEGASASLIVALRSGRPTLVSDVGCYSEVPDGLVLKCPAGREAAHVAYHLEGVLGDPEAAFAMGRRARAYAGERHSARAYVGALLPLLDEVAAAAPLALARGRVAEALRGLGLPHGAAELARATRGIDELAGG